MLYICRRGRENLRELKKDHFVVATDSDGRQYVTQAVDELTKKTREDNQSSRTDAGRMYETSTDQCPVRSFMKYKSKLNPECETLFQTPKSAIPSDVDSPWYKKMPVGKHTLGNFMSLISKQAQLSGRKQELSDAISHSIGLQPLLALPRATYLNISNTEVLASAVSKAPQNDTSLNFDVANQDMDLEMSSSQLAFLEEIIEQDVVSANDTNNENSLSVDAALPGKTVSTVPAQNTGAVITSSTTRRTMQIQSLQQQSPFSLHNCNVTINYNNYIEH